jgi:N-dimethylarginine dimethylaminohydrolase
MPIVGSVGGRGTFEGADAMWLDPQTVLIGVGIRTNDEGARQVQSFLRHMGVGTVFTTLPVGTMHLMGVLRFPGRDLAIAWPDRLSPHTLGVLEKSGYRVFFLPDMEEAYTGFALNFVTVSPGSIVMPKGNPVTQAFYEDLGVACIPVDMAELTKAAGAVGCLTGVLHRENQ